MGVERNAKEHGENNRLLAHLEAGLLLHIVDDVREVLVEAVAVLLDLGKALLQHLVLPFPPLKRGGGEW